MPFTKIPNEILCMFAQYLSLQDHSAFTRTNQHIASILQPRLLLRLQSLPLHHAHYAQLALHWTSVRGNLPHLKQLLETVTTITVINNISPAPYSSSRSYHFTTPAPCPDSAWSWISTRGPHLRLLHATPSINRWSRRSLTPAEYAIRTNNHALLRLALAASDSVDHAKSVVHYAGRHGQRDVLQTALTSFHDQFGRAAWEATRKYVLEIALLSHGIRSFLGRGETVKSRDDNGRTLLHRAVAGVLFGIEDKEGQDEGETAALSHPEVVEALLQRGAEVDACDGNGDTALHVAAELGHADVVKLLLLGKATVDVRDAAGCTPLHRALRSARIERWEVAEVLRLHHADFGSVDSAGVVARDLLQGPKELRSSRSRDAK